MGNFTICVPDKVDIDKCKAQYNGFVGNLVLYDMCAKYPHHTDADSVHSKIWLIGSAYSASIERNRAGHSKEKIYEDTVRMIIERGDEIDGKISALHPIADYESMAQALGVHMLLMDLFKRTTGLNKRSLASKYLHFHRPDVFYIYDSYTNEALMQRVKGSGNLFGERFDTEYGKFCVKAHEMRNKITEKHEDVLTLREFDTLLQNLYTKDKRRFLGYEHNKHS